MRIHCHWREDKAVQTPGKTNHCDVQNHRQITKHCAALRETLHTKVHIVLFHLYEVLEQAKVISCSNQKDSCLGKEAGEGVAKSFSGRMNTPEVLSRESA